MELTITPIAELNKSSFLRPFGDELAIAVSSDSTMAGKDIYVLIGLFSNTYDAIPDLTDLPKYGYKVAFPGSNTTIDMAKQSHDYSYLWENMGVTLQRTSVTTMVIVPSGLMRADVNSISGNQPIYPINSLLRNATQNSVELDNKTPSVYNSLKSLRVIVVVADTEVITYEAIDIPYTSRFYEKGLYNASPEFTNFDYKFISLSVYGAGFSLNTDVAMRFSVTGAWTAGGWVAIFEDNGGNNASDYVTDTNLHIKNFSGSAGVGSLVPLKIGTYYPGSAIVSFGAVTNVNGSTNYIDVLFNHEYFDKTKTYRVVFIPVKSNDYSNSFITDPLEVTDFVTPTYGSIEEHMNVYNSTETPFSKCVSGLVPHERLYSYYVHNKDDYNDAIATNSSSGTFDSNIVGIRLFVGFLAIPSGKKFDTTTAEEITSFNPINTSTLYGASTNIMMRPEWINKQLYLTYQLLFKIAQPDDTYSYDYIYFQHAFFVNDYTESEIEILDFYGAGGETITKLCGSEQGDVVVLFKINTPGNWEAISYLEGEYDRYASGGDVLEQKQNSKIVSQSIILDDPTLGLIGTVVIDSKKLLNREYCLEIIAENKDHIQGSCGAEEIEITLTLVGGKQLKAEYSIGGTAKQVELIIRPFTNKPGLGVPKSFVFNANSGDTGLFPAVNGILLYTYQIDVTAKMDNNCIVQGTSLFQVDVVGFADTNTITLNPI